MTTNTKTPAKPEAQAVELNDADLDKVAGGLSECINFSTLEVRGPKPTTGVQKPGDGSVRPFIGGGSDGQGI